MNTILITGINGFVASNLIDHCSGKVFGISRGDNHKTEKKCPVLYGDILDIDFIKRVINDYEINTIYHCAAQSIVKAAKANPAHCFQNNIIGTVNILEAVRQINPAIKVVIASSDKASNKNYSTDPYSTSKICSDWIAQSYFKTYALNANIVRCSNIYGGGDMNLSRLIPDIITSIIDGRLPVVNSGALSLKKEFIYIGDVCRAYNIVALNGVPGEEYNAGMGEAFTIGEIINKICSLMDWEEGLDIIQRDAPNNKFEYLGSEKINSIGWWPSMNIDDGLKKTIEWYKNKFK